MRLFSLLFVTTVFISACSPGNTLPPTEVISLPTAVPVTPTPAAVAPTSAPATAAPTVQPEATQIATAEPTPAPTNIPDLSTGSAWQLVETRGEVPAPRRDAALVYDAARERVLLFGGRGDTGLFGDTWAFNLAARGWEQLDTGTGPQPRFSVVAGMDVQRDRFIVTTGQAGPSDFFNDVWGFDLQSNRWTQLDDGSAGPIGRYGSGGGVFPGSNTLYITHGFSAEGRFDDTWTFDLEANTWLEVSPSADRPLRRCLLSAVPLSVDTFVLFGGCSSGYGPCPRNDTWVFDGSAGTWTEIALGERPSVRQYSSLIPVGNGLLLFGGEGEGGVRLDDLWHLDPDTGAWRALAPGGSPPIARAGHGMVWLEDSGMAFVFGGHAPGGHLNDVWLLTPST